MRCAHDGCRDEATHFPKICVPAKNYVATEPMAALVSLGLCLAHCELVKPAEFLDAGEPEKSLRRVFQFLTNGLCPPDFDRAWVHPVPIAAQTVH